MADAIRWRFAFEAEAEKHRETMRALADAVAKIGELQAMLVGAESELKSARRQAAKVATAEVTVIELYSCAVCSSKTNRYPAHSMAHHCCDRTVLVGPCCEQAVVESPELVQSIMRDCGHAPGCKRGL